MKNLTLTIISCFLLVACSSQQTKEQPEEWIQLFNGKDLTGWTVKIRGHAAGENFGETFYVEDSIMKVKYDAYGDDFTARYGHIYTNDVYSHYKLRVEYRFVGDQAPGGEGWAFRNSGAMLHSQDPATMAIDQDFPVSVEAQMLGGDGVNDRTTGNVCTPGTEVTIDNEKYLGHCYDSKSKTYHGDQWVTLEMEVYGDSLIRHIIEGDTILTYTNIVVGGGNVDPKPNIQEGPLKEGRISLQAESHPVEFRKVELLDLSKK